MPAGRPALGHDTKPVPHHFRTRVWSAGRLLLLAAALLMTFGAFFLTALRVTTRAREVKVPDVRGTIDDRRHGHPGAGRPRPDASICAGADPKVAADHVLSQDPAPGTVLRRQRAVRVRVSDGQRDPVVPSVVGLAERTAEIVLAQEQRRDRQRAPNSQTASYPAGTVIAQDPPASRRAGNGQPARQPRTGGARRSSCPTSSARLASASWTFFAGAGSASRVAAEVPYPGLPPGVVVRQTPQAGFPGRARRTDRAGAQPMNVRIAPSILAADFAALGDVVAADRSGGRRSDPRGRHGRALRAQPHDGPCRSSRR